MFFEPFSKIGSVADVKVFVFQALQDVHKKHNSKLVLVWGSPARPPLSQKYPQIHHIHLGILIDVRFWLGGLPPGGEQNAEVNDIYFAVGVEVGGLGGGLGRDRTRMGPIRPSHVFPRTGGLRRIGCPLP